MRRRILFRFQVIVFLLVVGTFFLLNGLLDRWSPKTEPNSGSKIPPPLKQQPSEEGEKEQGERGKDVTTHPAITSEEVLNQRQLQWTPPITANNTNANNNIVITPPLPPPPPPKPICNNTIQGRHYIADDHGNLFRSS